MVSNGSAGSEKGAWDAWNSVQNCTDLYPPRGDAVQIVGRTAGATFLGDLVVENGLFRKVL